MPERAEPATLLARTLIELTQIAHALGRLLNDWAEDVYVDLDGEEGREQENAAEVAFRFAAFSAWTLHAAVRIHPDIRDDPPTKVKNLLLDDLDEDAADWIEAREDWDDLAAGFWLRSTLMLLMGASEGICKLADWQPYPDGGEVEDDEDGLAADVADSLLQAGLLAACAVQWFMELDCDDQSDAASDD